MTQDAIGYALIRSEDHFLAGHPEHPRRFDTIDRFLHDLSDASFVHVQTERLLESSELHMVHTEPYLLELHKKISGENQFLDYGDTYCNPASFDAAMNAVGASMEIVRRLHSGHISSGFALVRPPGHHATSNRALGFCLLNNIALTARQAQRLGYKKVFIVDFDVHHGNGTNDIFYSDADVYYFSTHQWGIFPGSGGIEEVGIDDGIMTTMNIPLPAGVGGEGMRAIIQELLLPTVNRFKPDILLVSAGFDAHWRDPLASLQLSTHDFYQLAKELHRLAQEHCEGKIVFLLEGGYDPEVISYCVKAVFSVLAGIAFEDDPIGGPRHAEPDVSELIFQAQRIHEL